MPFRVMDPMRLRLESAWMIRAAQLKCGVIANKKRFYGLCQLPDGRWGIREFIKDQVNKRWNEITAFVPKDGSRSAVIDYLTRSGTRFKGPLPW